MLTFTTVQLDLSLTPYFCLYIDYFIKCSYNVMKITVSVCQKLPTRKTKVPHKRNLGSFKYQQSNKDTPLLFISSN